MKNYLYLALLAPSLMMAQESRLSLLPPHIAYTIRNQVTAEPIKKAITSLYDQKQKNPFNKGQRSARALKLALRNPLLDIVDTTEKDPLIMMHCSDGSEVTIISLDSSRYDEHLDALPENYLKWVCSIKSPAANRKYPKIELLSIVAPDKKSCYLQLRRFGNTKKEIAKLDALVENLYHEMIGMKVNDND